MVLFISLRRGCLVIFGLILFFLLSLSKADAATHIVAKDGSGEFLSIQACVNAFAGPGEICSIKPGVYAGQVRLTKAHSGSAGGGHFVIKNHSSVKPILDGNSVRTGADGLVNAIGTSYINKPTTLRSGF